MKTTITAEAHNLLRAHSLLPFDTRDCNQLPDGSWEVPLEGSTFDKVISLQFNCETFSDTLIRLCAIYDQHHNN
jgi:hypothetical protein